VGRKIENDQADLGAASSGFDHVDRPDAVACQSETGKGVSAVGVGGLLSHLDTY
jgi:hypothetical protein